MRQGFVVAPVLLFRQLAGAPIQMAGHLQRFVSGTTHGHQEIRKFLEEHVWGSGLSRFVGSGWPDENGESSRLPAVFIP